MSPNPTHPQTRPSLRCRAAGAQGAPGAPRRRGAARSPLAGAVLSAALVALLLGGCQTTTGNDAQTAGTDQNLDAVVHSQELRINELTEKNGELLRQSQQLEAELERTRATEDAVSRAKQEISEAVRAVQERFRGDSEIEVEPTGDGYRFVLRDQVLFASGSATLTDDGKQALERVAAALRGGTSKIQIEGHTDDVPVAKEETLKKFPRGNIELSVMRALAVWDWLTKQGHVREDRVGVCGYGPFRPRVPNRTDQDRMQNRRVEIRVAEGSGD